MLDKADLVRSDLSQGKIDYKTGGFFCSPYIASKVNYVLTIDGYGINGEHKTFKRFNDSEGLLEGSQPFEIIEGTKNNCVVA